MPIYEYECLKCGVRFELRRSMADSDRKAECPQCGAQITRRIFSIFATSSAPNSCAPSTST
ncbi:MAG: zinc ribbon domain-containing protein [Dehalococcoidales bacterium]|nr:zinc ribbon domain-containing protein [Dehalococcoidales bacterium]